MVWAMWAWPRRSLRSSGVVATSQLGRSVLATSVAGRNPGRKLGTILHLELPQDARDMSLDRLARQEQRARDIRVGGAARDEVRDLALAVAQAGEVTGRPCARSASPRADAKLAQELVDMRPLRRGPGRLGDRRGVPQDRLRSSRALARLHEREARARPDRFDA